MHTFYTKFNIVGVLYECSQFASRVCIWEWGHFRYPNYKSCQRTQKISGVSVSLQKKRHTQKKNEILIKHKTTLKKAPPIEPLSVSNAIPNVISAIEDKLLSTQSQIENQLLHNFRNESCDIASEEAKELALKIGKFGFPSNEHLRFYSSFTSSINYQTRIVNW